MAANISSFRPVAVARVAGLLYVVIIVAGIGGAGLVRAPLEVPGDAAQTVRNLLAAELAFRASVLADVIMALADVALGVLLYFLLKPAGRVLALMAMAFRLAQAAAIVVNLLNLIVAVNLAKQGVFDDARGHAWVASFLDAYATGYDLSLFFFAVNCGLTGALVLRAGYLPRVLGVAVAASGLVYFAGSAVRVVAPGLSEAMTPLYGLPLVAELAFAGFLLIRGLDVTKWRAVFELSTRSDHASDDNIVAAKSHIGPLAP